MIWAVPMGMLCILAAISLFWLPWSAPRYYYFAGKAFNKRDYRLAIENYHRSLRLGGSRYYNWENIKRAWGNLAAIAEQRGDAATENEAVNQMESAERLEGPDPSTLPSGPSIPKFHPDKTTR